jgi:PAS domain-containing protein
MPAMASSRQGSERLNAQLLVDSIPALIHTANPDGYLDYFNKPWLEYLGVTLDKVAGLHEFGRNSRHVSEGHFREGYPPVTRTSGKNPLD